MKKARLLAALMSVVLTGSVFIGCSKNKEPEDENKAETKTEEPAKKETVEQKIIYNLGANPKTLDPQLNTAVDGSTVLTNAFEGLMREGKDTELIPGVAEKYEISDDETVYTFHLRKDAKWSDGKPVVAGDFEYAWKRGLDPVTKSEYASQLFYIKNGKAFFNEKANRDDVGVKALDDQTLEVTLEYPTKYFLKLVAFPTYFPVRKDIVEKDPERWALSPETYVSNGPFKMSDWVEKESITFVKNENYWKKDQIKLETLEYRVIDDEVTYLNAFKSEEIDIIEAPPQSEIPKLLADGTAVKYPYIGTYFYVINMGEEAKAFDPEAYKALSNPKVRKALNLAIDRQLIIDKVTLADQLPAVSFVPDGVNDAENKPFGKEYLNTSAKIEEAKKLLAEAGYPDGEGFPTIKLSFNTGSGHQNVAQAVQDMWKNNLNINFELNNEEWAVFQTTRNQGQYSIARHGWIADYNDPISFLEIFQTGNGNNDAKYSNKEFDKNLEAARIETDNAKRNEYLHKAEDILMEELPCVPVYFYNNIICANPKVKELVKSPLGQMIFDYSYVE